MSEHGSLRTFFRQRRELRAALRFWVDRAERFETELPASKRYMAARGVLNPSYTVGRREAGRA